jgi:hypothetical protein
MQMIKSYVWRDKFTDATLGASTKGVLQVVAMFVNDKDGTPAYPSIELIMRKTSLSERAVIEHLKIAQAAGWLHIGKDRFGDSRYPHNVYFPTLPEGLEASPDVVEPSASTAPSLPKPPDAGSVSLPSNSKLTDFGDINHLTQGKPIYEGIYDKTLESKAYRQNDENPSSSPSLKIDETENEFSEPPGVIVGYGRKHGIEDIGGLWGEFVGLDGMQRCDPEQYIGVFFDWLKKQDRWKTRTNPEASAATVQAAPKPVPTPEPLRQQREHSRVTQAMRDHLKAHKKPDSLLDRFDDWYPSAEAHRPDPMLAFRFFVNSQGSTRH